MPIPSILHRGAQKGILHFGVPPAAAKVVVVVVVVVGGGDFLLIFEFVRWIIVVPFCEGIVWLSGLRIETGRCRC